VVDQAKIGITSNFITVQNLVVVSHTVCTHVGGPKSFEDAEAPPPWDVGVSDPKKYAPPTCVTRQPSSVILGQTVRA